MKILLQKEIAAIWARLEEGGKQSIQDAKDMCIMLTTQEERMAARIQLLEVFKHDQEEAIEAHNSEPPCCECGSMEHDCQHCSIFEDGSLPSDYNSSPGDVQARDTF